MKFFVGVTDNDWFDFLSARKLEEVNFWQPGGRQVFRALQPGAPFLFKRKGKHSAIAGVGFFSSHTFLPVDLAWTIFGEGNGMPSRQAFRERIAAYRSRQNDFAANPNIGCIVLTDPIWFDRSDWIAVPASFSRNIVKGKGYDTTDAEGAALWKRVLERLEHAGFLQRDDAHKQPVWQEERPLYGAEYLAKVRLGQGAFRVLLTDHYQRRCAVTGERTLPVLEAAHVKPYADSGPHRLANGILLRSDWHRLYDSGYVTLTEDHKLLVSPRIREEFENGKDYYRHHGQTLRILPDKAAHRPAGEYVRWHNEHVYRG